MRIIVRPRGPSVFELVAWLVMFSALFGVLAFVVPAFKQMFQETGVQLPVATEILIALSGFASSPAGFVLAALTIGGSIALFRKRRGRRSIVGPAFIALATLIFFAVPLLVVLLFLPTNGGLLQKL